MVADYLQKGRENAIPSKELAAMCGFSSTRELRLAISRERADGAVILSTTTGRGGYFLPGTEEEVKQFITTLSHRAGNTFAALRSAKALLAQLPGQMEMEEI